jgi:hypothetical protein
LTTQVNYQPQGHTLNEFHHSDSYGRVVIGPLGSGKTFACIMEIFRQVMLQKPDKKGARRSRILCVRNTYPELESTTIKDFQEVADKVNFVGNLKRSAPTTWTAEGALPDETTFHAEIIFLAFDSADDQKKARGLQLSGVWFNELKELSKANMDIVLGRIGRYPNKEDCPNRRKFFIGDSNAPARDHWLAKMAFDEHTPDYKFFIQPPGLLKTSKGWEPNPRAENRNNLDDDYYTLNTASRKESWIRANLCNEFIHSIDGRPVHPDFVETTHVAEIEINPSLPLTIGIDFGRTPAAAICQRQEDGRWFVLDEICTENMGALEFGRVLKKHLNQEDYRDLPYEAIGDPAGNAMAQTDDKTPFMMLRQSDIRAIPAPTNDFEERVTVLDELLIKLVDGHPAITIHPRCKTLVRGLAGEYHFRRIRVVGEEKFRDKPDKGPTSQVCEALHYGLLGAGEGVLTKRRRTLDPELERAMDDFRKYQAHFE